jgi:hypothetical protein
MENNNVVKVYKQSTKQVLENIEYRKNMANVLGSNMPGRICPITKILFDNGFDPISNKKSLQKHRDGTYLVSIDHLNEDQMLELANKYFIKIKN